MGLFLRLFFFLAHLIDRCLFFFKYLAFWRTKKLNTEMFGIDSKQKSRLFGSPSVVVTSRYCLTWLITWKSLRLYFHFFCCCPKAAFITLLWNRKNVSINPWFSLSLFVCLSEGRLWSLCPGTISILKDGWYPTLPYRLYLLISFPSKETMVVICKYLSLVSEVWFLWWRR